MKLVVDRQAMVDTVLLGFGEAGADNPVPVGNPASYVKEAPKQDIDKAKELLAEAGYKDGLKFDLYTAEGVPGMVRMAQVYAEMAKAAGIDINVIVTPAESFWDDVWLKKSIVTSAWSMRPPGEGLAVASSCSSSSGPSRRRLPSVAAVSPSRLKPTLGRMRPRRRDDQHPQHGRPSGESANRVQAGVVGPMDVVGEDRYRARRGQAFDLGDRGADGVGLDPPAGVGKQGAYQREVTPPVGLIRGTRPARGRPDVAAPASRGAAGCSCRYRPDRRGARTLRDHVTPRRRPPTGHQSPPIAPPGPAPRPPRAPRCYPPGPARRRATRSETTPSDRTDLRHRRHRCVYAN